MNLRPDLALLECSKSHICVTENTSFQREDFRKHGLHVNSRGKNRLTQLTAKSLSDKNVSGTSSIPVITIVRASLC